MCTYVKKIQNILFIVLVCVLAGGRMQAGESGGAQAGERSGAQAGERSGAQAGETGERSEERKKTRPWVIDPREAVMVIDSVLYVCDYPYYVYYPDPRTGPQWHLYTYDGEVHSFYDWDDSAGAVLGMRLQTLTLPAPKVDLPDVMTVCQDGSNVTIPLTILSGKPDTFLIDYSPDMAARIGRRWDAGKLSPETNEIVLRDIPLMGVGHNYAYLSLGEVPNPLEEDACMTLMKYIDLNFELGGYLHQKYGRLLFVDNNPDNDVIPANRKLLFTGYQWYKDNKRIEGATEQFYTEDGKVLKGEYYAEVTATDGITYKCCPIVMTGEEENAEAKKCWRNGELVIEVRGEYYDLRGNKIN